MKQKLISLIYKIKNRFKFYSVKRKLKNPKYTHLYIGTPTHGNLGDLQIRNSAIEILKSKNINFIELDCTLYYATKELDFSNIKVVCLHGGGNFGDVYMPDVMLRDDAVRSFKDKKIVMFPQTLYVKDNSEKGEINITKAVFDRCPNLVISARENESFKNIKTLFTNNKVILSPDTVMFSDYTNKYKSKRKKEILFLLRRDKEKSVDSLKIENLKQKLNNYISKHSDTIVDYRPMDVARDGELSKMFKQISRAKVVVTDRLHGMIFCAITNTPCIVLSNYNHKIKSSYETWLKHLNSIKFYDILDEDVIYNDIEEMYNKKDFDKWKSLNEEFEPLIKEITL